VPVLLLLQPRGHLGGYFLYIALAVGAIGIVVGGIFNEFQIQYDAFKGWDAVGKNGETLFPFLFITIACGACSGFHSMIASGTTSKQLSHETDAQAIGYGAMLLEAMVATIALVTLMILRPDSKLLGGPPNKIYANGQGEFLSLLRVNKEFAVAFGMMAFTTFVYDTLDVCTRLGRYIVQELTGLRNWAGRWLGSALTAGVPLYFLLRPSVGADGKPIPPWLTFWFLFGATNQLLAALTLLGVTVWLWRTRRSPLVWLVTGVPTVVMYVMSLWALAKMTLPKFHSDGHFVAPSDPVPWAGLVLIALATLMLVDAARAILGSRTPPTTLKPAIAS
jgi:carbon starvation protein